MATVQDPTGSPVVHYNKSGTAVIEVATGNPGPTLPHVCGYLVVLAEPTSGSESSNRVTLPVDADVGDVVEVHCTASSPWPAVSVRAPAGESILGTGGGTLYGFARIYRKLSDTVWGATAAT